MNLNEDKKMPLREKDFNTKKEMVMQYISTASKSVSKWLKAYIISCWTEKVKHAGHIPLTNFYFSYCPLKMFVSILLFYKILWQIVTFTWNVSSMQKPAFFFVKVWLRVELERYCKNLLQKFGVNLFLF